MPFKCFSCGLSFDTVEEFAAHRRAHQRPGQVRISGDGAEVYEVCHFQ